MMDGVGGDPYRVFAILGEHRIAAVRVSRAARKLLLVTSISSRLSARNMWQMSPRSMTSG